MLLNLDDPSRAYLFSLADWTLPYQRGKKIVGPIVTVLLITQVSTTLGIIFRLYINALLNGNPFVVAVTVIGAVALAMGPFQEGLSRRDPAAIGLVAFIIVGVVILLALAIIDRKLNPPEGKSRKPSSRSKRR